MSEIKIPVLDLKPQYEQIKSEVQGAINRVLESGQFIMGPDVKMFEQEVAEYVGVKHAIAVNSGTDALVIGLRALGIGEGDEVITTPFSFFATAESISNLGAKPVFADIDSKSFNIDPKEIKAKITPRTKAIMPVHLYGQPAAMGQIMELAQEYGLKVIEDCAQSFGARYWGTCSSCQGHCQETTLESLRGKFTGAIADVGAYSFFPSKNLGAYGDGGMVVTNDDQVAEIARMLRVLDTLQAAILRVKLPYLAQWNEGRRQVAKTYNELLADVAGIITPELADGHVFHQYTIRVLDGKRDKVQQYLGEQGIGSMIYYPVPQDQLPVYQGQYPKMPVSDLLGTEVLSLPIWPEMASENMAVVVNVVSGVLE